MGMGVSFQYPMGMGTDTGVIFKNGYGCGYNSTRPIVIPTYDIIRLASIIFMAMSLMGPFFKLIMLTFSKNGHKNT